MDSLVLEIGSKIKVKLTDFGLSDNASLSESIDFLNSQFEKFRAQQDELMASNKALLVRNEMLEKRVADLEQYSRLTNVEVKGVPLKKGEDCRAILKRMGDVIECPVSEFDIETVHRVPSKSSEQNLIARFVSRDKKNEFIRKARKARLRARHLGFSGANDTAVYVNDHLTISNKTLFAKVLTLKKAKSGSIFGLRTVKSKLEKPVIVGCSES
ncbi:hypothetical protein HPB50_015651 [Hyalomma asiaticum]|uniref:Uncharacterized protein n=1 Tax=Hyalomma asiaticum TaxID=266040 RepID=A0ACB7TH45_HYAAI|nr:hypothetical protein HPB50_015651 [Hyalomma asiaticum]